MLTVSNAEQAEFVESDFSVPSNSVVLFNHSGLFFAHFNPPFNCCIFCNNSLSLQESDCDRGYLRGFLPGVVQIVVVDRLRQFADFLGDDRHLLKRGNRPQRMLLAGGVQFTSHRLRQLRAHPIYLHFSPICLTLLIEQTATGAVFLTVGCPATPVRTFVAFVCRHFAAFFWGVSGMINAIIFPLLSTIGVRNPFTANSTSSSKTDATRRNRELRAINSKSTISPLISS